MPPLLSISAFRRTDANGGSRGEAMPERERHINFVKREQNRRSSERHQACLRSTSGRLLPQGRKNGRVATEENRNVKMTDSFGHSKDLITLSLSQVLTYSSLFIIKIRGRPRVNIRLFLLSGKGGQLVFCPLCSGGQATMTRRQKYLYQ